MKILFVYPEAPWSRRGGGIRTYLSNALKAHYQYGNEVFLLTWNNDVNSENESIRAQFHYVKTSAFIVKQRWWSRSGGRSSSDYVTQHLAKLLPQIIDHFRPDIIETSDYLAPLHAYMSKVRAGLERRACPIIVFNHGLSFDCHVHDNYIQTDSKGRAAYDREEESLHLADHVVVPSRAAQKRIELVGVTRSTLIREPFDFQEYVPTPRKKAELCAFAHYGRLSVRKGVKGLARFCSVAHRSGVALNLSVFGLAERAVRHMLIADLPQDLRSKIRFHGAYERPNADRQLASIGFACNFSRFETFGYSTVEAIAAGCIPIVTEESPMAELLPSECRCNLMPANLADDRKVLNSLRALQVDYEEIRTLLRKEVRKKLSPAIFVDNMNRVAAMLKAM